MTDYTKTTNFAAKDSLPSGNANKIVKGAEIDTEFNNIATASATKANIAGPTFTGTVTIPTADINGGAVDGTTIGAASASSIVGTTIVANTSINIAGDGATVTGIKDEDDMSSNSATKLATQQSIKAYVDSQVTAQDLDVTDGSSSIDIDLDSESLGILGGTGIDSTASGTGVTLAIDSTVTTLTGSQTLTNKTLTAPTLTGTAVVASLDISGDVDVDGTLETDALSINGTTVTSTAAELNILDGVTSTAAELNILDGVTSTTAELNILDGVTSTAAELNILDGVTSTTAELNILDGVTSTAAELNILDGKAFLDEDDMSSNSATGIASQQSIKAYVDSQVTAQDLDFQADSGGALSIDLDSETLTFTGGTGIDTSGSGNAVTFAIDSTVATLTGSQTLTNKTLTSPDINTPDIDGGAIDGTTIGGSTPAAGSFTTLSTTGNISSTADIVLTKTGTADAGIKFATAGANRYLASDENGVVAIGTGTTLMGGTQYLSIDSGNATFSGSVTTGGAVTIDPADGVADDAYALTVRNNEATDGRNYGLWVRAGSNSSDESFSVRNHDNSATYLKVRGDGNTGISTSAPKTLLHVSGLTSDDDPSLGASTAPFFVTNTADNYGLNIGVNNAGASWLQSQSNLSATAYDLLLNPLGGNVGIGGNPAEKLNIIGTGGTAKLRFDGDSSNLQNNFIGITGYDDLIIASDEANTGTASTIQFRVDASEVMRISGRKVGIGTANGDVTNDGNAARTYVGIIGTANRGRLNIGTTASNGADTATLAFTNGTNVISEITVDTNSGVQNAGKMYINSTDEIRLSTAGAERLRIRSDGNAGLGSAGMEAFSAYRQLSIGAMGNLMGTASAGTDGSFHISQNAFLDTGGDWKAIHTDEASNYYQYQGGHYFRVAASTSANANISWVNAVNIDTSGRLLVAKSSSAFGTVGHELDALGQVSTTADGRAAVYLNRLSSDGNILQFHKDGTEVGTVVSRSGVSTSFVFDPRSNGSGLSGGTKQIQPANENGAVVDNSIDIGSGTTRFQDIYATNGTIQTSDRNEKQDIEALSDAEQRVAVAAKGLLRKFRWKSAVEEKGDDARIHFGIIAQDLQDAFTAEGLDAGRYAMFISSTWTDEETGEERTRLGVRYSELLAFIISSI